MSATYRDAYDLDELPEYPPHGGDQGGGGGTASLEQLGGPDSKGGDKTELVKGGRREGEAVPLEVDGFAYELGRVHHDVDTFRDAVARLAALKAQVVVLEPEDSTLVAQSLLASLAVQTADASQLFKQLPQQMQTFGDKLPFLKPGAGRFLVTSAESTPLKSELALCATTLRSTVHEVRKLADVEDKEKQSARVRLLKTIKAQMGPSGDDSLVMAALLTAEREGSSHHAEQLKPLAYIPLGLAGKVAPGVDAVDRARTPSAPPSYFPLGSSGRAGFAPLVDADEEDRVGSYGEPLAAPSAGEPSKWARVALGVVVLSVMLGSTVALMLWTEHDGEYLVSQDPMTAGLGGLV
ncbi:hypothetical protein JCM8208_003408 [Rhodotorula glutinis]